MTKRRAFSSVLACVFSLLVGIARGETFKDGETVCFLGDSITHGGSFHSFIYDYYLTRFPERTIRFVNAGVAGDTAGGSQRRLAEDVIAKKPTSVAVMFGMNDLGGNYVANPEEKHTLAQQRARDGFVRNMEQLVGRIRREAGEPKLLFITPSPFDQTVVKAGNQHPGRNDGLGLGAALVRELALKSGGTVVDFHGPMTAFNLEQQKKDPAYTIVGQDRVHPGVPGHLMMAWLFLKAQGAPALVSRVAVDARAGRVAESANAAVTGLMLKEGGVTFTVLERALPFPVAPAAQTIAGQLPIEKDLNQEILSVSGLAAGTYELRIDGAAAGRHTAAELAKGVNLAFNRATPQFMQAQAVARLNETRRVTETTLRNYATVRWYLKGRQVNPDDLEAVREYVKTRKQSTGYYEEKVPAYLEGWSARETVLKKIAAFEQELFAARKPVPHAYAVQPVK